MFNYITLGFFIYLPYKHLVRRHSIRINPRRRVPFRKGSTNKGRRQQLLSSKEPARSRPGGEEISAAAKTHQASGARFRIGKYALSSAMPIYQARPKTVSLFIVKQVINSNMPVPVVDMVFTFWFTRLKRIYLLATGYGCSCGF